MEHSGVEGTPSGASSKRDHESRSSIPSGCSAPRCGRGMPRFKEEEREENEEEEKKTHRSKCSVAFSRNLIRSLIAPVVERDGDGNG